MKSVNEQPLISVIVPIYKVEQYLDRCVESIVNQTYKNLEIILVDDGSPDNCPKLCDEWANKDNRVRVIHKENGGLSDARNAGMAVAKGEYIGFVDSDDYISEDMYELLYINMISNDSDISACGVEMIWEEEISNRSLTLSGDYILTNTEAMEAIIKESVLKQPVWYKLYKSCLIKDVLFPVAKSHEDVFWSYKAIAKAKKVSVFDKKCYFYIQRSNSIMGNKFSLSRFDGIEAKCERLEFLTENYPLLVNEAKKDLWGSCLYLGQCSLLYLSEDTQERAFSIIKNVLSKYPLDKSCLSLFSWDYKIWTWLSKYSIVTVCRVRNLLKLGI